MDQLDIITEKLIKFRDDRDWEQFHNSKDLALAISIESAELLELFLWKKNEEFDKDKLKEELADIFAYALLLAEKHDIDIYEILNAKISKNEINYPVDKAKGTAKKYTEL